MPTFGILEGAMLLLERPSYDFIFATVVLEFVNEVIPNVIAGNAVQQPSREMQCGTVRGRHRGEHSPP